MHPLLVFLIVFYIFAFIYDKIIDNEIKSNNVLAEQLSDFKFFHSFQSRPKALYALLSFHFWGISTVLNIVGSVLSLMMYFGLLFAVYFLAH